MSAADDMDRQIDAWAEKPREKAQRYRALTTEMESISGTAESASGKVRVTVNRAGIVTALEIEDDIRGMRGTQLAGEILSTMRAAQAGLGDQVVALMQEKVPEDTHAITAVAESYHTQFAEEPEEDEAEEVGTYTTATPRPIHPNVDDEDDPFGGNLFDR